MSVVLHDQDFSDSVVSLRFVAMMIGANACLSRFFSFSRRVRLSISTDLIHATSRTTFVNRVMVHKSEQLHIQEKVHTTLECMSHVACKPSVSQITDHALRDEKPMFDQSRDRLSITPEVDDLEMQDFAENSVCIVCHEAVNGICFTFVGCHVHFECRKFSVAKIRQKAFLVALLPELRSLRGHVKRARWRAQKEVWETKRHRRRQALRNIDYGSSM